MAEIRDEIFDQLFHAITDAPEPFPWQRTLFRTVQDGRWPAAIDVPTGLGKTSVMAVWFIARHLGVPGPRRLVYIVDRRAVVDQATEEAQKIKGNAHKITTWKQSTGNPIGLRVSTLRGQHIDNRAWLEAPDAPAIVVGTVDMIGSRLLFEGYGVSRRMRPVHAGLLGCDTLLVLDESHLCPPFAGLLRRTAANAEDLRAPAPVPCPHVLTLSATGRDDPDEAVLSLSRADREHPEARQRLTAAKLMTLHALDKPAALPATLIAAAQDLVQTHRRVLVFCDRRETAAKVFDGLKPKAKADAPSAALWLLVGARRVGERERDRDWLDRYGFLSGIEATLEDPAILVATSAGEVGVDIDADAMACDLVPFERMVQRLGRVNRRGGPARITPVRVFAAPRDREKAEDARARLDRLAAPLRLLRASALDPKAWDASPDALDALKQDARVTATTAQALRDATTPEPLYPALTRAHVDAWAMTSLETHPGRALIQPWLRGWDTDEPRTTVAWRRHLPWPDDAAAPTEAQVSNWLEAAPVLLQETLETRTAEVVEMLCERAEALRSTPGDAAAWSPRDPVGLVLAQDGTLLDAMRLEHLQDKDRMVRRLTGRRLILRSAFGGLADNGLVDGTVSRPPSVADDETLPSWLLDRPFRVEPHPPEPTDPDWRPGFTLPLSSPEAEEPRALVVWVRRAAGRDGWRTGDSALSRTTQALDEHLVWAAEEARALATALGLPSAWVEVLEIAARLHDRGKRRPLWQQAMGAPCDGTLYAKTKGGGIPARLGGYRHEFGSLVDLVGDRSAFPEVWALDDDRRDLVLHLITAHHGHARPVIDAIDPDVPPHRARAVARDAALRFARLHRRWGPWGLAWWEALLRAADWRASARLDASAREDI